MNQKIYDWQKAKEEIDLMDYFYYRFPNFHRASNAGKSHIYVDNGNKLLRSDKYEFIKGKDGFTNYFSRHSSGAGNLIHFIKNEVAHNSDNWRNIVNEELGLFYPLLEEFKQRIEKEPIKYSKPTEEKQLVDFSAQGKLLPLNNNQLPYLTNFRQLSIDTINSPLFKNVICSYKDHLKNFYCIGIPVINEQEQTIGINRIFTYENSQYFNQKLFVAGSDNYNGFTKSNTFSDTNRFVICEGIFDAMAHFEIYRLQKTEYICSNGELGNNKLNNILRYIKTRNANEIILANDNDIRGNYFDLHIISHLIPSLKIKAFNKKFVSLSIVEGNSIYAKEVDTILNRLLLINDKVINEIKVSSGDKTMLESSDLVIFSKNSETNEIDITLPYQNEFLSLFNKFVVEIFQSKDYKITIEKSDLKDFNADLIRFKSESNRINYNNEEILKR